MGPVDLIKTVSRQERKIFYLFIYYYCYFNGYSTGQFLKKIAKKYR